MTYLASSAGALVVDRNNWHTNANTAYDSGVWGSGTHWQSRWSTTNSALTSMTTDRDYWKTTVAHDDPNVWTNRYNAGYSQATTDKQPVGLTSPSVALTNITLSGAFQQVGAITLTIAGYWHISYRAILGDGGAPGRWCYTELRSAADPGNANANQLAAAIHYTSSGGTDSWGGQYAVGQFAVNTVIRLYVRAGDAVGNFLRSTGGIMEATFIPTPAQPH